MCVLFLSLIINIRLVFQKHFFSSNFLFPANSAVDFTTVKFLLQDSKSLLHAFSTRSNYDGVLPQAFAQVNKLLQTLAEVRRLWNAV